LVFGSYTPGVISATLVNLPVMTFLLFLAVRERWVSGTRAITYAVMVPICMGVAVLAFIALP
jgi:hypothetical protein